MRRVIIESPYAGDVARHVAYARACMADCLRRGEAPYASHLLYTQMGVLDDTIPEDLDAVLRDGQTVRVPVYYRAGDWCVTAWVYADGSLSSSKRSIMHVRAMGRCIPFGGVSEECAIRIARRLHQLDIERGQPAPFKEDGTVADRDYHVQAERIIREEIGR